MLDADGLRAAVADLRTADDCGHCSSLRCAGWESVSVPVGPPLLEAIGTLRDEAVEDPTLEEHHPEGTSYWQAQAPIALRYFPFNRCTVWRCAACARGFVQYTEYGGYYTDHRIRAIDPALIC